LAVSSFTSKLNNNFEEAMKSRDGFVAAIVAFVVLVLIVVGGIAWVHYYYLPHMAAEDASSIQTTPTTSVAVVPASPSSIASTSSTQTKISIIAAGNPTKPTSCTNTNLGCFIAAAQTCSLATTTWTGTIDVSTLFAESVKSQLAIKGLNASGKCIFSDDAVSATGIVTSQFLSGAEAQGLTAAQAQQEVQGEANQSAGQTSECTFTPSALVSLLTDWSKGSINVNAFASGNCTSNSTTNTEINVSVPLTTSTNQ
jgi:hypothetical protein